MMSERRKRAREIQESIKRILLDDWDPIGVSQVPEANDEYDAYIGGVYGLLSSGASEDEIVQHLSNIEAATMALSMRDPNRLEKVAKKLINLNLSLSKAKNDA